MKVHCFILVKHASCGAIANGGADTLQILLCIDFLISICEDALTTEEMRSPKPHHTYQEDLF